MSEFKKKLHKLVAASVRNCLLGNDRACPDFMYEDRNTLKFRLRKEKYKIKSYVNSFNKTEVALSDFNFDFDGIGKTYDLLTDEASKNYLVRIIAFRMLGPAKIEMPLVKRKFYDSYFDILKTKSDKSIDYCGQHFDYFDLSSLGFDVKMFYDAYGLFINYFLKQYEYSDIKPKSGDFVIDGGACVGDTALYFANAVGKGGKVFAFEFVPSNLKLLQENLNLNEVLKDRVEIVESPLWSKSGSELFGKDAGPASLVSASEIKFDFKVKTISIDDMVREKKPEKIDFIKLDIEGAELECLKGAEETIKKFKPELAVCLYHDIKHFVSIPEYLHSIMPEYEFYLKHHTIHLAETVLYAKVKG